MIDGDELNDEAERSAAHYVPIPERADEPKNTMTSRLTSELREAIVSGQLEAGSKINLDKAKTSFQVSLSPLREALARLISDGLVVFTDNRGYRVSPISLSDLEEITQLRSHFESYALREAISNADAAWEGEVIRSLHRLNKIERDAEKPETLEEWESAHQAFHLALITGCKKPILLHFCAILLNLNDRYRRTFLRVASGDPGVATEHSEIAQAAVARDADYACQRLAEHIQRTGNNLRRHVSERGLK